MIRQVLFGLAMPLSLLPFFHWFRGTPHQLAAIKELEERMPQDLLAEEDNAWFDAWKASGIDQEVYMRYFTQLDNATGTGYRECFSSAAAMVAAFYKKVQTDDEYNAIRIKYGDTTSVNAQIQTLESLGLNAKFIKNADRDIIEMEIEMGRPVIVGWLDKGPIDQPTCNSASCGHYSVISGYRGKNSPDPEWIMQDPRGLPDMKNGGHSNPHLGRNVRVRQAEFDARWQPDGRNTGWAVLVDDD